MKIILPTDLNSNKRQKIGGYESTPIDGQNSWNVDFDGIHVYLNNEITKKLTNALILGAAASEISAIIMSATGVAAPAGAVAAITGVVLGAGVGILGTMNEGSGVVLTPGLFGWDIESR